MSDRQLVRNSATAAVPRGSPLEEEEEEELETCSRTASQSTLLPKYTEHAMHEIQEPPPVYQQVQVRHVSHHGHKTRPDKTRPPFSFSRQYPRLTT